MPAEFESCVKRGGRVRTKELSGGKYMHICYMNGKSYAGEVKSKKSPLRRAAEEKSEKKG